MKTLRNLAESTVMAYAMPGLYLVFSLPLFLGVYKTSSEIIDEKFHLRQGKYYCLGRFDVWDDKITTLPGLYIVSALFLPAKACSTFYLRSISLLCSVINTFILIKIKQVDGRNIPTLIEAVNLAILPPLYFFAHLYYTDTVSVTTVLGMYYFWLRSRHGMASMCGFASILMRQTNIIWVTMLFGISTLKIITLGNSKIDRNNLVKFVSMLFENFRLHSEIIIRNLKKLWSYLLLQCMFLCFVLYNGSIVVGDKAAHHATLHIPQIFYFSIFILIFGFSFILPKSIEVLTCLRKRKFLTTILVISGIILVKYNTVVHPYLLADNRHYTFYIWNRFYGKFAAFRYIMVPVYIYAIAALQCNLKERPIEFQIMYYICLVLVLCFQSLLEIRYFIVPYLILRLNIRLKNFFIFLEFISYVAINALTFYTFFNKEIVWDDYKDVQRLIW